MSRAFIVIALLAGIAMAQSRQVGVTGSVGLSRGAGSEGSKGIGTEVVPISNEAYTILASYSWRLEPKDYLGDGSTHRIKGEGRFTLARINSLRLFVSASANYQVFRSRFYTKHGFNPAFGGGLNYNNLFIGSYKYYLPDRTAILGEIRGNRTRGHEISFNLYQPLNHKSKWLVRVGMDAGIFRFEQLPGYPNEGTNTAFSLNYSGGLARRW